MQTNTRYESNFDVEGRMAPIIIAADLGNNFLKVTLLRYEESRRETPGLHDYNTTIKHAYVQLSPREWKSEIESSDGNLTRGQTALTHAFQLRDGNNWHYLKIGQGVADHRNNRPLLGSQKYIKGGIDALLVAAFCELLPVREYPDGHDNIILGIGHPPTEFHQARDMVKLVQPKGGHQIKMPDGTNRKFVVRATVPFDESVGGLMCMQDNLTQNGQMRDPKTGAFIKNPLQAGDRLLMIDAGGRLGSIGWITYEGGSSFTVDYASFMPIEGGMITIRESIRENLAAEYSRELRGVAREHMTDKWVDRILKTRKLIISGNQDAIDVTEIVDRSLTYLNVLRDVYRNNFGSGITADHITLTGGTIRDLYDEISEELNHHSILPVASLSEINKANVWGAMHIILDTLRDNRQLPMQFQGLI